MKNAEEFKVYLDGSFINGSVGYGLVILKGEEVVEELFGTVGDTSTRQVAGELYAVEEAIRWCRKHSVKEVSIYYDYKGIEKWATGEWKAKQPLTQKYAAFVRGSGIRIHWHKVASHTGDHWNDRADELAKKGAGLAPTVSNSGGHLLDELSAKAGEFVSFLEREGLAASFEKVFNGQFARVVILEGERPVGVFDLYNTVKKPFSPYMHDFKNPNAKLKVESLWRRFHSGSI